MKTPLARQGNFADNPEAAFWRYVLAVSLGALVAALLCVSLASPAGADDDGESVPRQIVVKLKPGTNIGYINNKYRTRTLQQISSGGKIYLLRTPPKTNSARLANRIQSVESNRVFYAEPNFRAGLPEGSKRHRARPGGEPTPTPPDSTSYRTQYAIDNLNLPEAHGVNRGAGAVVAVIDTGVQSNHPELVGKTIAGYDFIDQDRTPNDVGNRRDDDGDGEKDELVGHGTHVAGIVALAAPEARIMPVRALDTEGRGTTFGIAKAVRYAVRNGADVVNLSLGSSQQTDLLADLLGDDDDDEEEGRVVFVAAAGNDNNSVRQFPAAEENAIAVTSVDQQKKKSGFANFGGVEERWVKVAAPGTDIHAPFPTGRYATWSGTSMATPFVAGQAALVHGVYSSAGNARVSPGCVTDAIQETAEPLTATDPTYASRLGSGHAEVAASTIYAQSTPCTRTDDD